MTISPKDFYLVGLGASAGGLEALLSLLFHLKPTGRIVYVIAQHMAHDGHSTLVMNLLNRNSALPVVQAEPDQELVPDHVYLIPAGNDGVVERGRLRLRPPRPRNLSRPSVDVLFASIAAEAGPRGVGVILSGVGSDGAAGCRAIKAKGGMTFVQDLASAQYDGMPSAAIEAGAADYVCRESEISREMLALLPVAPLPLQARSARQPVPVDAVPAAATGNAGVARLVEMIFDATGIDFSGYKEETLVRRLEKRMATLGIDSMGGYFAHIGRNPHELTILQQQFLVSLSSFFRDRESFRVLEHELRAMLERKPPGEAIRVWVPGCASGEEVYTLAIILSGILGERGEQRDVTVTGADMNPEALDLARAALYRQTAFREMEEELLERYFTIEGLHCRVNGDIRALCRFERADVLKDAHPDGLDLISCRNLLIYMKGDSQVHLLGRFHRSLLPHGLLFLGPSETIGPIGSVSFSPVDHAHRLYRKRYQPVPTS